MPAPSPYPLRIARTFIHCWFYLALAAVFMLGWYLPATGQWLSRAGVMPYLVGFAFFVNGFTLPTQALLGNLRQWPLLIVAMVLSFLLPAVVVLVARRVLPGGDTPIAAGFQLLSVLPTTLVSAVILTRVAGGNGALALYITVLANALAVVVVPALLLATLDTSGTHVEFAHDVANLAYTVLLPTLAGQLARRATAGFADRHRRWLGIIAQVTVLLFIVTGLAALPRDQGWARWLPVLLGVLALHLFALLAADGAGRVLRVDVPTRRALTICTAQKTLALAVLLWDRLLHPLGPAYGIAILPAIAYYMIELFVDSIVAQYWGHRQRGET